LLSPSRRVALLLLTIIAPLAFLWTGVLPLVNVTPEAVLYYLLPMIPRGRRY
jgi:hypothetical protein